MPNCLKRVPSEIPGFPSDFADFAYKTRVENLSWSCRCFFREVLASDDDEECAFTCLSRATGGVWHDLSRVANLPEDLDVAFFSGHFLLLPSQSPFPVGSVSPLRSSLPSLSCRRRSPSSSRRDETGISLGKCASPWLSSATLCGMFLHRRRSLLVAKRLLATCMHGASAARGK